MSSVSEEDDSGPTLKELVTKTLESNGVLGKLQAQLRASVFLILEEESKKKNIPLINAHAQQVLSSSDGKVAVALIQDFFMSLGLDFSLAVFNPESRAERFDHSSVKKFVLDKIGLQSQQKDSPYLLQIIQNLKNNQNFASEINEMVNGKQSGKANDSCNDAKSDQSAPTINGLVPGHEKLPNGKMHNGAADAEKPETVDHVTIQDRVDKENTTNSLGKTNSNSSLSEKDTLAGLEEESDELTSLSNSNKLPLEDSSKASEPSQRNSAPTKFKSNAKSSSNSDENTITEEIDANFEDLLSSKSEISNSTQDMSASKAESKPDYEESL